MCWSLSSKEQKEKGVRAALAAARRGEGGCLGGRTLAVAPRAARLAADGLRRGGAAGVQIAIRDDENCKVLCRIDALTESQAKAFRGKIEDEYRVLMCGPAAGTPAELSTDQRADRAARPERARARRRILDNLPIAIARVREENGVRVKTYERGFPVGRTEVRARSQHCLLAPLL